MNRKNFSARDWFRTDTRDCTESSPILPNPVGVEDKLKELFPRFTHRSPFAHQALGPETKFSPVNCFTPGWSGGSLGGTTVMTFEQGLKQLQLHIKQELLSTKEFPRSIKMGLHSEFLSYAENLGLHFDGLENLTKFWSLLNDDGLSQHPEVAEFIHIYCGRVASITFLKLRFIEALTRKCNWELSEKAIFYPSAYLSQIFKKGSKHELKARAFESNIYSWYSPGTDKDIQEMLKKLVEITKDLVITDIIKNVSAHTQNRNDQSRLYSHALSHVGMGLFINSLLINFPLWIKATSGEIESTPTLPEEEIISCKFFGDYLESLSLSHWLAQENNKYLHWDQILCSDFKGLEFTSGIFAKICNELQFLTFLVEKAETQNQQPIDYLCKVMGGHFKNRKTSHQKQSSLPGENPFFSSNYDRVVLNLCHFPKNNPQHFMFNQIQDQIKFLKPGGYLYVLSSKKLFVPSLKDRLIPILRELKTEAIFDLENIKGKGELGSYLYIFSKNSTPENRQLCGFFRISAELTSFQLFAPISDHLRSFYLSHLSEIPPMAQLEFPDRFHLEFYQEAIVNGVLVHAASEDTNRVTHPLFFKSLMSSCVTLDSLYDIRSIRPKEFLQQEAGPLLPGTSKEQGSFLIVDYRQKEVRMEVHPLETLRAIYGDYGESYCSYFNLHPKLTGLNPNLLRFYLNSPIGQQLINITFAPEQTRVKGNLNKFFVPRFLLEQKSLPAPVVSSLAQLDKDEKSFQEMGPDLLKKSFKHVEQIAKGLIASHPFEILSWCSSFKENLQRLLWKMDGSAPEQKVCFGNPLVHSALVTKPTNCLYPDHPEVFVQFTDGLHPADIHLPLATAKLNVTHEGDLKLYSLDLFSENKLIAKIHAEELHILFIEFILRHAVGVPMTRVLKAIQIPSLADLKLVIDSTRELKALYQEIAQRMELLGQEVIHFHLAPKSRDNV